MPRKPRITGKEFAAALQKLGWKPLRQRGSHAQFGHPNKPEARVTLPLHVGLVLPPKTMASALSQAGLTFEELLRALKRG